jgi:hypothetical protein
MKTWVPFLIGALIVSSAVGRAQSQPAAPGTQTMMASQQKMMAAMQANERKLDDLVAQMNAAHGTDRLERAIAVVNELAASRKQMSGMMLMHDDMTQRMKHMPAGAAKPDTDPASQQPEKK